MEEHLTKLPLLQAIDIGNQSFRNQKELILKEVVNYVKSKKENEDN